MAGQVARRDEQEDIGARLGARLRRARAQAALTQADAARAIGLAQPAMARLESGRRRLGLLEAIDLANLYRIEVNSLDPRPSGLQVRPPGDEEVRQERTR